MPPVALDKTSRDGHLPLTAALPQMTERGAIRCLAIRTEVGAEAVARVEKLWQDRELD